MLWKIGFEWAQLKRIFWPCSEQKVFYFAFGANLSIDVLQQRRIRVYQTFDYVLENAKLNFSQMGFYKDHGYASADATAGEVIYGKMYLIQTSDAACMDFFEGVPFLQVHDKVFCSENGLDFFYYRANNPRLGLKPTQEYLDYLVNAYKEMSDVPNAYIETFVATEVLDQFLPQDQTGKYVHDINRWPEFLRPMLVYYERICLSLVRFLWNRSLLQWLIKK